MNHLRAGEDDSAAPTSRRHAVRPPVSDTVSVLVVDNQAIYRAGVVHALAIADATIHVVGEAADANEVLTLVEDLVPQVVLLNTEAAGSSGLELIRTIRRTGRTSNVIITSNYEDEDQLFAAIRFGAAGYVLKSVGIVELCAAIHRVAVGDYPINNRVLANPALAAKVLASFREQIAVADHRVAPLYLPLSAREIQVLEHVGKGNSNKEIARILRISDQTVKNHITSIMRKLAVNDRTQAVVYALHHGWIRA